MTIRDELMVCKIFLNKQLNHFSLIMGKNTSITLRTRKTTVCGKEVFFFHQVTILSKS